jgi:hypothetical protein
MTGSKNNCTIKISKQDKTTYQGCGLIKQCVYYYFYDDVVVPQMDRSLLLSN